MPESEFLRHRARWQGRPVRGAGIECGPFAGIRPGRARARRSGRAANWNRPCSIPAGACARWRQGSPRFNPMSYHNGSVWPHDTACARAARPRTIRRPWRRCAPAAGGCSKRPLHSTCACPSSSAGFTRNAASGRSRIRSRVCRRPGRRGSPFMILEACLGITIDAERKEGAHRPARSCPTVSDWLEIGELRVGDQTVSITFRRVGGQVRAVHRRGHQGGGGALRLFGFRLPAPFSAPARLPVEPYPPADSFNCLSRYSPVRSSIQPGYSLGNWLTSVSAASSSPLSFTWVAATLSSSWSTFFAR